jgi:hypothetical protein
MGQTRGLFGMGGGGKGGGGAGGGGSGGAGANGGELDAISGAPSKAAASSSTAADVSDTAGSFSSGIPQVGAYTRPLFSST